MNLRRAGWGLGTALVLLVAAEGLARWGEARWVPDPAVAGGAMEGGLPPHPHLGWEPVPGDRVEAGVSVHINRLGIRGPEPGPKARPRLVATGDSSVYGWGVHESERFVDVAAAALDLEPWAAAVPGYSSQQSLAWLRLRGEELDPDVLLLANLWSDHSVESWVDAELLEPVGTGPLEPLALYRVLRHQLLVRGPRAARRIHWERAGQAPQGAPPRVPLDAYRTNLDAMAAWIEGRGGRVALLALAHPCDIDDCQVPESFQAYRVVQEEVALSHRAPFVHGGRVFAESGRSEPELLQDGIHPTVQGHRLLGWALADALSR